MNNREKIITYMKAKRLALFKITGINLYIRADYNEIRELDDEKCDKIWKELSFKGKHAFSLCPQCVLNRDCDECEYGKRHNGCNNLTTDNTWGKICKGGNINTAYICHPIIDKLNKESK